MCVLCRITVLRESAHISSHTCMSACGHIDTTSFHETAVHGWPSNCVYFDERFCVSTWLCWIKEMERFSFRSCLYGALQFLHISPFQKLFFIFSSCNLHLFLSTLRRSILPTIWCPFPTELNWLLTTRSWAHTHTHTHPFILKLVEMASGKRFPSISLKCLA